MGGGAICSSLCYTQSLSCHTERNEVSQRHNEQSRTFTTDQNFATFLEGSLMEIAKSELSLESVQWGEFKICDLFEIYTGALINQNEFSNGKIPRITATDANNGFAFFTENIESKKFRTLANFISISFLGSVFYQKNRVSLDMKIHAIKPKNKELNVHIALFLIPLIKNFTFKYMYGYQLSTQILKIQKIMLPIDSKGNPHWGFMESFMRKLEQKHLQKIIKYYENKLLNSNGGAISFDYSDYCAFIESSKQDPAFSYPCNLDKLQWREFYFYEIFHKIKRGKRLIKKHQIDGKTPYVSSSSINNGVDNFINNNKEVRKFQNCISLANSGSVGSAFFHQYDFIGSDHITALENATFNPYIYLFMLPLIQRLSEKYSFNREINDARIKREKLVLPIDSKGNPNYDFMESFMRKLEQKHLQKIIAYYQNKLFGAQSDSHT